MSDLGDAFKAMRQDSQNRRAAHRGAAPERLTSEGIPFVSKNGGAHLIVEGHDCFIDYWPGTGRWTARKGGKTGFGIRNLVKLVKKTK